MKKERVVVVCPGRGTYNKDELGYLKKHHPKQGQLLSEFDAYRNSLSLPTVTEMDGAPAWSASLHAHGDHAAALIYACAYLDFLSIPQDRYEIVAVTGNSMGWYIALACAQAMDPKNALHLIQTMGSLGAKGYGGQVIYPITGDDWKPDPAREAKAHAVISGELYLSIKLGGYVVYGGTDAAIDGVMKALPPEQSRYPMKLVNHSAFHTPVMNPVSAKAQEILGLELFQSPAVPLVSGRGEIYQPWGTDAEELRSYTLGYQVVAPYDFSKAIEVALKEFAPDRLIVLGPGTTLGGAIGQCLVQHRWRGITSKADFLAAQEKDPFLLAMGLAGQRSFVAT